VGGLEPAGHCLNRLRTVLYEVNFALFVEHIKSDEWEIASQHISEAAIALKAAGADFLVVTSNTGSSLASDAVIQTELPVLDIVETGIAEIIRLGFKRPGLLSTIRTDKSRGYHIAGQQHGIDILSPDTQTAQRMQQLIFDELIFGVPSVAARQVVLDAIALFSNQGADCVILGCTDFVHLLPALEHSALPLIDSTTLHARGVAQSALRGNVDWELQV
jgi:aspartate racemase